MDTFHVVDIALFIPFPGDFTFLLQHDKIAKQDSKELKFTLSYFNKSQGLKLLKNFSPYFFVVVSEYYEHGVRVWKILSENTTQREWKKIAQVYVLNNLLMISKNETENYSS